MPQQDFDRSQLMQDIIAASDYCDTQQLEAVLKVMLCCKNKNEERNGKSKKAPIRSMENTSKEDN